VHATVRDADTGDAIPSRITIVKLVEKKEKVKEKGADGKEHEVEKTKFVEEYVDAILEDTKGLAVRKGVLYTKRGTATFDLPPGKYMIYATRGFEYGVHAAPVDLGRLEERSLDLKIRREVDTKRRAPRGRHPHPHEDLLGSRRASTWRRGSSRSPGRASRSLWRPTTTTTRITDRRWIRSG
jgi:hypothetical protein